MKALRIFFIFGSLLSMIFVGVGCSSVRGTTSPKPDIQPVIVSNQETRKSITETKKHIGEARTHIKKSQEESAQEGKNLDVVNDDLNKLLNAPTTVQAAPKHKKMHKSNPSPSPSPTPAIISNPKTNRQVIIITPGSPEVKIQP